MGNGNWPGIHGQAKQRAPAVWGIWEGWLSRAAWWVNWGMLTGTWSQEELGRDVLIGARLGCHSQEIAGSRHQGAGKKASS